jgi:hypothetical protein
MKNFYTPTTFDANKYKRSGWKVFLTELEMDKGRYRLIVRVATGRKYWPLFTVLPNFEMGINDPILKEIKFSLNSYTHFMIDRFIDELNVLFTDLYQEEIDLRKIVSGIKKEGYYSSHNF